MPRRGYSPQPRVLTLGKTANGFRPEGAAAFMPRGARTVAATSASLEKAISDKATRFIVEYPTSLWAIIYF